MNRREFSGVAAAGALAMAGLAVSHSASADSKPRDGKEFLTLDKVVPGDAPAGKIEVIEFFWYNCPHCNAFEPKLELWIPKLPKDVFFRRVPVAFRPEFQPQQRLFYTLEALGKLDELHRKVFVTIHGDRQPLQTDAQIAEWAEKQGLNKSKFAETYASFGVATKVRKAGQLTADYQLQGVPSFGVAGRHYTDGTLSGSIEKAQATVEFLVAEARSGRKPA